MEREFPKYEQQISYRIMQVTCIIVQMVVATVIITTCGCEHKTNNDKTHQASSTCNNKLVKTLFQPYYYLDTE